MANNTDSKQPVLIVGGGISGLSCAVQLVEAGRDVRLFEAAEDVGGRIRTDVLDGFRLDHGFQVLLTAYPEAQNVLDYDALQLGRFDPGALIWFDGKFHRLVDPWRRPRYLLSTAVSRVGGIADKICLARLRSKVTRGTLESRYDVPEMTTIDYLHSAGFSQRMLRRFFRPFLGGIFLDPSLTTSSRMFEFVFRMFSLGDAALPAEGMQQLPRQLASRLPAGSVRCNTRVTEVGANHVRLESDERITGSAVVVATESPEAEQLCGESFQKESNSVACLYFSASKPPVDEGILLLNGEQSGPINNLCVPSNVCPTYAPTGKSLVSASVLDTTSSDDQLELAVRSQLEDWFGDEANSWQHLRTYRIHDALPNQQPPALTPVEKPVETAAGIFICGDHRDTASIQGAMSSGRRAAEAILTG